MTSRTAHITRADLLRLIVAAPPEQREAIAALVGFERREPQPVLETVAESIAFEEQSFKPPPEKKIERPPSATNTPVFWHVIGQHRLSDDESEGEEDVPDWWTGSEVPEPISELSPLKAQTRTSSLLHWPRLLGFYRTHLITEQPSQHLDEPRFVRQLAEARFVSHVPRKTYRRWPPQLVMLIDRSDALYPLWQDYGTDAQTAAGSVWCPSEGDSRGGPNANPCAGISKPC